MHFTVSAPASSANLGPGFDALGLALDLWNDITIDTDATPGEIVLLGSEAGLLDARENLSLTAMTCLAETHGRELPPFGTIVRCEVPVARGMGSSAAALVAGLVAANHLLDLGLSHEDLYAYAWRMEGHGDNVGAALYGGAVLAAPGLRRPVRLLTHEDLDLEAVVFVPKTTGATTAARAALPPTVPHPDAAFNIAAASALVLGLHTGDRELIAVGMRDRLHEPYRKRLFAHLEPMTAAARAAGALGAALSGAGPSVLALADPAAAPAVAAAMEATAAALATAGDVRRLRPAFGGVRVVEEVPALG
ncbi:MAG: homoserine kinase [Thermomicrobiales bacterium]|nr:homoserine kinase [Thermomicrobiales bacterium]